MTSQAWMRRFICSAFLCTSYQFQGTDYNNSIPQSVVCNNDCHCDEAGEIYNLAPLQRTNGSPRFPDVKLKYKSEWHFAYNPCASFKLGNYGDCYGDVAICRWTQSSYENIGKRSKAKFVFYKDGKRHIEYTNERKFPTWKNIVRLVCDRNKTSIASAEFKVISRNDGYNRRIFRLIHNCACGNGCPMNTLIPSVTRKDVTPAPLGPTSGEKISFPVGITATFVVVALCVPLVIWRCRRRQRDNNPNPIPPLIENAGGCSNYGVTNTFTSQAGRRKDTNLQRYSSRRKFMNSGSCSDITMPSKDGDRGYASV